MKKILSILLCTLIIFSVGCGSKSSTPTTTKKVVNSDTDYTIRDNYIKSIQQEFPKDIFVAGLDLINEPHNAEIGVNYQGNKDKTMKKIAEIFKTSEDFFKTQNVEYIYFDVMDQLNNKGKLTLHFENNKYELKDNTIE